MLAAAWRPSARWPRCCTSSPTTSTRSAPAWPRRPTADLIITSGGVSAGAYEVVKDALTGSGVEFAKVAMQPGMPQGAGNYRGVRW